MKYIFVFHQFKKQKFCISNKSLNVIRFYVSIFILIKSQVALLSEFQQNTELRRASTFCPTHGDQFRFYDEECKKVLCRDCVILDHNGHKCVQLKEAATKARVEVQHSMQVAIVSAAEMDELASKAEASSKELSEALQSEKKKVIDAFGKVQLICCNINLNYTETFFFPPKKRLSICEEL